MIAYVRVREDAAAAIPLGLMPGASYPLSSETSEPNSLRVVSLSGDFVKVPKKLLEMPVA